jgi:hypothetical protein
VQELVVHGQEVLLVRRHHRRWFRPDKTAFVLTMHTKVHHLFRRVYHAEITVELEISDTETLYFTIGVSAQTERGALRRAIELMESSDWFQRMRAHGAVFKVFGVLEDVYRGYLT